MANLLWANREIWILMKIFPFRALITGNIHSTVFPAMIMIGIWPSYWIKCVCQFTCFQWHFVLIYYNSAMISHQSILSPHFFQFHTIGLSWYILIFSPKGERSSLLLNIYFTGGLWATESEACPLYDCLITNTSKEGMAFSDFPPPSEWPTYITPVQVRPAELDLCQLP